MKFKLMGCLGVLCVLGVIGQSRAGCGGYGGYNYGYNNYHQHNYVQQVPIAVPVLVPAFQFQYTPPTVFPQAGATNVAISPSNSVFNPSAVTQLSGNPATTLPQRPAQQLAASPQDRVKELARALLEEMQKQSGGTDNSASGDNGPPVAVDPNASTQPVSGSANPQIPPQPVPKAPPGIGTAPTISPEQAAPAAMASLKRNCAACHTGAGSRGDMVIFSQPDVINPNAPWKSILREINAGHMPPKDSQFRLTQEEANYINAWLGRL